MYKIEEIKVFIPESTPPAMDTSIYIASYFKEMSERLRTNRPMNFTSVSVLALSVAGCGGGGSTGNISAPSAPTTGTGQQLTTTEIPPLPASGNVLSLSKLGTEYVTSSMAGFSLKSGGSHYIVANDITDNEYTVKLDANGAGTLEFEFEDADDVIILADGSTVSGFSQLNVKNGTIDATLLDLGSIDTIVVASSIKITYQQVTALKSLVSNSSSSSFEIAVSSDEEAQALQDLITSNVLEIIGGDGKIEIVTSSSPSTPTATSVTPAVISSVTSAVASVVSSAPPPPPALVSAPTPKTLLIQDEVASISIENNDRYINKSEALSNIKVTVDVEQNHTVKSIKLGGVSMSASGSNGDYTVSASSVGEGEKLLVVEIIDDLTIQGDPEIFGGTVTLSEKLFIDTIAPNAPTISIEGESNGLNAEESNSNVNVTISADEGVSITSVKSDGTSLSKNTNGTYRLDASNLQDGIHQINVETQDQAGNVTLTSHEFTIDANAPSEALIAIEGSENGLNKTEAAGAVNVSLNLNGAVSIDRVSLNGEEIGQGANSTSYTFDASLLSEGSHSLSVVTADEAGNTTEAVKVFSIDRTPPDAAFVDIPKAEFGLQPSELVDPINVNIVPAGDAVITSITLNGSNLSKVSDGQYQFNGNSLAIGRHDIIVSTQDTAGNITETVNEVTVLGYTSDIKDIFEFRSTPISDTQVQIETYVKNVATTLTNGITNFDFDLLLEANALDYVEGSFKPYQPSTYALGETSSSAGIIRVAGYSQRAFEDYTSPFATFRANILDSSNSVKISFLNIDLNNQDFVNADYYTYV